MNILSNLVKRFYLGKKTSSHYHVLLITYRNKKPDFLWHLFESVSFKFSYARISNSKHPANGQIIVQVVRFLYYNNSGAIKKKKTTRFSMPRGQFVHRKLFLKLELSFAQLVCSYSVAYWLIKSNIKYYLHASNFNKNSKLYFVR